MNGQKEDKVLLREEFDDLESAIKYVKENYGRQYTFAFKLEKNENTVSRWCSNKVQPSLPQLGEIAEILKVDIHSLISNESSIPCEK